MNWQRAFSLLLMLLLFSCSGARLRETEPDADSPDSWNSPGDTAATASFDDNGVLKVQASNVGTGGLLTSLDAPDGLPGGRLYSSSTDEYMALAAVHDTRLELCVAPLHGPIPGELNIEFAIAAVPDNRLVSVTAKDNRVRDLLITRTPDNNFELSWTAINLGDYDHNGEVNVADLIPLAQHYHESAPQDQPWTRLNPRYWVDGDGNNEINIADLTTIARNFGNSLDHYDLLLKGELLMQVPYAEGEYLQGSGLPRRFKASVSTETAGFAEEFSLVPVGYNGESTGPASNSLITAELSAFSNFGNMQLLSLCNDGKTASEMKWFTPADLDAAACYVIMRIIDPIEDIGSFEPPMDYLGPFGSAYFDGLKREKLCYLEAAFLPAIDPASGQPSEAQGPDSPGIQRIVYPLQLPDDGRSYEADIRITAVGSSDGGLFYDIAADSNIPGRFSSTGIRMYTVLSHLARDLDGDGDYTDESWLHDSDRNALSDALEERLRTDEQYFVQEGVQVVGTVQDILPEKGEILLSRAYVYCETGSESQFEEFTLHFTELTEFVEANPLNQTLDPSRIRSVEIMPGSQLTSLGTLQRIGPSGEPVNFWAQSVTQLEPIGEANSILVVPALTQRRPGQIVNVTVYASDSASPFNSLDIMTLHVLGGAEVIPGSINPGIQGGANDETDGIWAQLGPDAVNVSAMIYPIGFAGGRYFQNFEVNISPVSNLNISAANGALFNFDLRVYEPCVVLAGYRYSEPVSRYRDAQGNIHDWISQDDADSLFVNLTAAQPQLLLPGGAISGNGSYYEPYVVTPGASYPVQVIDEIDGDITGDANCWYVVSPELAGYLDYANPVINVPPGYVGNFSVNALYPGKLTIPPNFARRTYFRSQ